MRTAIIELSKDALLHNIKFIKNKIGKANIMAMLKADAYGHDSVQISKILQDNAKDLIGLIGVARIKEALILKQSGINIPIVLIQGILSQEELNLAVKNNFSVVIYNNYQLELLSNLPNNSLCKIWLKFDTGMNRLGFRVINNKKLNTSSLSSIKQVIDNLHLAKKIDFDVGLMSHFSCAADSDSNITLMQRHHFKILANNWNGSKSIANSAAILSQDDSYYEWVRPGIMLYGISPFEKKTGINLGLKPVMSFKAFILDVKLLHKGDYVGYGAKYCCPKDIKAAVISVGYGDGYPWSDNSKSYVFYKDRKVRILGAISMDMMVVDCSDIPDISIGDKVELWGNNIPVEKIAHIFNTIPYELITKITSRVDKVII